MKIKTVNFVAGMLAGAALFGGGAAYAAGVIAERSTNAVYVDGQRVELKAYTIEGENYVKLRDVGETVGFNVYWDGAVKIDTSAPYTGKAPAVAEETASGTVTLPTDGSKYIPKPGDKILCNDGYLYEIKDVSRWEDNVFSPGLPELPEPTCDWSLFPEYELPKPETVHYFDDMGHDILFVRNQYELRRMIYTLYNAIGNQPSAWKNGKPLAKVILTIPDEYEPYTGHFWPWRSSELEKHVENTPCGRFRIDAFDMYSNGIFQYTRYLICPI